MFKLFKDSFKITNDCIILATPLIIFLSILGWYFEYAAGAIDNIPKLILAAVTILVMLSGFFAAWLYMVKKTINLSNKIFVFDRDRAKALWGLALSLPKGIGRLFLPILGLTAIYIVVYSAIIFVISYFLTKYAGTVNLDSLEVNSLLISSKELIEEINELPKKELLIINCWYCLISLAVIVISFLTMLWIPEIVYCEKNPFKALCNSIIKLFGSFPKSLLLFTYIVFLTITISILNTLLMFNPFSYFLVLMLYYYFLVYIVVLLFTYYERNFIEENG